MKRITFEYTKGNLDIAYLLGIYLTDGYVKDERYRKRGMSMRLRVVDRDIAENVQRVANNLVGQTYNIRKVPPKKANRQPFYEISIHNLSLCEWLKNVTGDSKDYMPNFVYTESKEWQKEFLAGLIDGDGWVSVRLARKNARPDLPSSWWASIGLCGDSSKYFKDIRKLLTYMNVDHSYTSYYDRAVDEVRIKTSSFVENDLYFKCERKAKKVEIIKLYHIGQKYNTQPLSLNVVQRLDA